MKSGIFYEHQFPRPREEASDVPPPANALLVLRVKPSVIWC